MRRATVRWILPALLALAGVAPVMAATPIASAETNTPGITVDLMSLERKGGVLTVKWAIRNTGASKQQVRFGYTGPNASTYLVDQETGKKYFVLTDTATKRSVASMHEYLGADVYGLIDSVEPGATRRYWAKFPAPPPEVKALTVFFDGTEPFEDAPITDK